MISLVLLKCSQPWCHLCHLCGPSLRACRAHSCLPCSPTSEMFLECDIVSVQTVTLDSKERSHQQTVWKPWYFNSAVAWHIFPLVPLQKLVTSKGLNCFSPWRYVSPLGVSQMYFVFCMTASMSCSPCLTVSDKTQGCLLAKKDSGKDSAGHLCAREAWIC